jgi:hypothetical protein
MLSPKRAFIHRRSLSCFSSAISYPTLQSVNLSLFHALTYTCSHSTICSVSLNFLTTKPGVLSVFHSSTHSPGVLSVTLSLFRPHSQLLYQPFTLSPIHQVFCQSIFHSLAHTTSCSVSFSLFHTFGTFSRTRPFNRSPSQPSNHYLRYCDYGNNRHRSTDSGCRPPVRHRPQQVLE